MKAQIPWLRVFVEGVVIVGSILLAFGVDAWWRRGSRGSDLLLSALLCVLGAACIEVAEPYPDISGTWSLQMSGMPGGTQGADGTCSFDPLTLHLFRDREGLLGDGYWGSHDGGRMTCTGVTAAATAASGLRDTVVVFVADTVTAAVGVNLCIQGCDPERQVTIQMSGLSLGGNASDAQMDGWFRLVESDTIRVAGTWTAAR